MRNPFKRISAVIETLRRRRREPLRLELSIVDHCNLNCKGCTHYCPIAPEHFMAMESIERNLAHLAGVDDRMFDEIYVLGGEPLLHPKVGEACKLARKYFPEARIKLLTNGTLVGRMEDDFWDVCRETGTILSLTIYPIKIDYKAIEDECRRRGVEYDIFHQEVGEEFFSKFKLDDRRPTNPYVNHIRCFQNGCLTLRGDRIYPCATSAYADLLNERFGRGFEWKAPGEGCRGGDYVEVKDVTDKSQIERLKNRPTPFCKYCTEITPTSWGVSKREATEWL